MKIIAGPCAIEGVEWFSKFAMDLLLAFEKVKLPDWELIIKGSYDKANRTSAYSPRGVGLHNGLDALERSSELTGCRVTTDVHNELEAEDVGYGHVVDVIQIPALLGKQTSLIQSASQSGKKVVNLKKPQFMAVSDVKEMCMKAKDAKEVWLTHRGTLYGPGNLIVDPLEIGPLLSREGKDFDRLFLDITHTNRGVRSASIGLAEVGGSLGVSGYFMEVHPDPENAICDSRHQLTLGYFTAVLETLRKYA